MVTVIIPAVFRVFPEVCVTTMVVSSTSGATVTGGSLGGTLIDLHGAGPFATSTPKWQRLATTSNKVFLSGVSKIIRFLV